MSDRPIAVHDWTTPLPTGHHTVEASAGTGKTFAIVGMAALFLAEGRCQADQLLVLTFSRSATRELRRRLLDRLTTAEARLSAVVAGRASPTAPDDVEERLLAGQVDVSLRRLRTALADIDHATVTTIHAFADDLLRRIGDPALGDLLESNSDLALTILGDVYLRIARHAPDQVDNLPWISQGEAIVAAGMRYAVADLRPDASMTDAAGIRVNIAKAAGFAAAAHQQAARTHGYDDLLRRLDARLTDPVAGPALAASLRRRFQVGLVDEFQDTDLAQWSILRELFADPDGNDGRTLVMVGDPKQAIYGFRGADVNTYLAARGEDPDTTLRMNRRSDRALVDACSVLFADINMGAGIRTHHVSAAHEDRLVPAPVSPVAFRVVDPTAPIAQRSGGHPRVGHLRQFVAADVAAHVVELLAAGFSISGDAGQQTTLTAKDIAVLVRTNAQAAMVRDQLQQRHVPVVLNGVGNVLVTPAARAWLALLRALLQPWNGALARVAALSDLIGWTTQQVATADEASLDALHIDLHELASELVEDGVMAAFRSLDDRRGIAASLQGQPGGSRRLADLHHVTEVLHAEQRRAGHGIGGLIAWLETAMATATDPPPASLARRLERDDAAVEIMTVHGAKGLQRGIVLAPFLWDGGQGDRDVLPYTDPDVGRRVVDVGGNWPRRADYNRIKDLNRQDREHEEMRLAYVAATRAQHHLVLWWAAGGSFSDSPLAMLLSSGRSLSSTDEASAAIQALIAEHPAAFSLSVVDDWAAVTPSPTLRGVPNLALATLDRPIDSGWRRYSYSGLVNAGAAAAADDLVAGSPKDLLHDPTADRPVAVAPVADLDGDLAATVPLSGMPGGADVGTTIHAVLEHVDFADGPDRADQIRRQLVAQSRGSAVDLGESDEVVNGLIAMLDTPLGPVAGGRPLAQIPRADRIDEMAFELPVLGANADEPDQVLMGDLADLLEAHLADDDPFRPYGDVLRRALGAVEVRGFLAGYIDLIARVPDPEGGPDRYLVADYKTNRLAPASAEELQIGHYATAGMAAEMLAHHYPLQALFYAVATHRYLRWRIPDYDPGVHLAGVAYLFLRGMTGPEAPVQADGTPYGVFAWRPPVPLLTAIDELLATGRPGGGEHGPGR